MDKQIVSQILKIGREDISRHLSTVRKDYQHRSSDLIRSTVLGVFKDGKWTKDYYRFDSKQPEEAPPLRPHDDWDLDQRAVEFLSEYKLHYTGSRFTAVIAATAPYAVRVESTNWTWDYPGYALAVLKYGINRIGGALMKARPDSAKGSAMYGYIFETTGTSQIQKNGL